MENDETHYILYVLLLYVCTMKKMAIKTLNMSPSVPVLSATNMNSLEKSRYIITINNIGKH